MPPKWTADWFPQEFTLRNSIFSAWRQVCISFWYEEYLWPIVEYADVYRAKSGEDVWWSELTIIVDRAGRELALRPEMTPTITRMIASHYSQLPKPIRYFSIANFFRNERPQRWRNREFWQVNFDCFWSESLMSDVEIIQIGIEIMKAYGAPKWSFVVYLNNRYMIDAFLENIVWLDAIVKKEAVRTMDKRDKLTWDEFTETMISKWCTEKQTKQIKDFLSADELNMEWTNKWFDDLTKVIQQLSDLWYGEYVQFKPSLMRWFDYYDGTVFEFFDNHPDNRRAMFWWWRYNGLANIFGVDSFPAVGAAPWDEPAKLFIESRWLVDQLIERYNSKSSYYFPLLLEKNEWLIQMQKIAQQIRKQDPIISLTTSFDIKKINKSMEFANKQGFKYIIIFGEQEYQKNIYKIKKLSTGEEETVQLPKRY